MAKFVPAGMECSDGFDDYDFDEDEDNDFGEPFVSTSSVADTTTKSDKVDATTPGNGPAWGVWEPKRSDVLTGSVTPIDDFRHAVKHGHIDAIKQFIEQGIEVDYRFSTGWTALMYASHNGDPEVVKILLDNGADANYSCDQFTVLMAFCGSSCKEEQKVVDSVKLLLEKNVAVNAYDRYHVTALIQASRKGRALVVCALIEAGADLNKQDNRGNTGLMAATLHGHIRVVRVLLEKKADIEKMSFDGSTALEIAINQGHTKIQQLLERVQGSGDAQKRLVLTEDDIQELEADSETKDSAKSLLGNNLQNGVSQYGELEMLLAGTGLSQLIPLFQEHEVTFQDVLRMSDQDFVKMGVTRLGNRKKLLDAVHHIHKKEWLPNSLTTMQYSKKVTSQESVNMVQNLKKHCSYMASTVGYVADHIRADSTILLQVENGCDAKQLTAHTEEAMSNVRNLYYELTVLRRHLSTVAGEEGYQPADLITTRKRKKRSWFRVALKVTPVLALIGVVVWKSDNIVQAVSKSTQYFKS